MHLIILTSWHIRYSGMMLNDVKFIKIYAQGTAITHTDILSKRKVINVFPPDLSVKYEAFIKASRGIHSASMHINAVA